MNECIIKGEEYLYNHLQLENYSDRPHAFMRHSHSQYELIFLEKGNATCIIEDKKYTMSPYDMVFIRPNLYHFVELQPNSKYQRYNIAFEKSFVDNEIIEGIPSGTELINCCNAIIVENFRRMDYYSAVFKDGDFTNLFRGLLLEILYNIGLSDGIGPKKSVEISSFLSKILVYINNNLKEIRSVADISSQFFIAESYLFKLFKKQLKISPKKYINMKRLQQAQMMIIEGQKPTKVYLESGFETYTGFYKQYKQFFGHSPSEENIERKRNNF